MSEATTELPTSKDSAVLLVGHGRKATDTPADLIEEYQRARMGPGPQSTARSDVERRIREWPRTDHTDPYRAGLEKIAKALSDEMPGVRIAIAFNEFCAPSIEDAAAALVNDGVRPITLVTTMFTPGGNHAERDLPAAVQTIQNAHPEIAIRYVWPFPLKNIAAFLAASIEATKSE